MARNRLLVVLALAVVIWTLSPAQAKTCCPFCSEERGPTLVGDFVQAAIVMVGTFTNAKLGQGGLEEGSTDFQIEHVLKHHELIKNKKVVTLPRYVPQQKSKFLVFCDVYKNQIDPYRGEELPEDSVMPKYLAGAVAVKDKTAGERLRYCFDFLNCPEYNVSLDAYREFAKADYQDYKEIAKKLPANIIAYWLKDPKTPAYRYGLYASLIGHCGRAEHAKLLRNMIDDPEKRKGSGIDGLLFGYVMLQPKEAWTYLKNLMSDSKEEFLMRYAGLRTVRFLWELRPDLIDKKDLVQGAALIMAHGDMADFAIEDLRRWQRWEMTDQVLGWWGKETHDVPVVKRAILRFALQSPTQRAEDFVKEQRKRDPQWVEETEELLKYEPAPTAPKAK